MPDDAPRQNRGHEAWTVAGEERRLSGEQVAAFEVDEGTADAFIAQEVAAVADRLVPVIAQALGALPRAPDPGEMAALLAGVRQTIESVARGDAEAIGRFRVRAARVGDAFAAQGKPDLADLVRKLPDTLTELLARSA